MGINRKLADLAQFIDSSSSGESITKAATGVGTKAVVSADVQGSAGTFTFSDSSYIANVISPSYITAKTGKATSLTGTKSMFQGAMPDLIPQTTATYDLGDSAKPIAELILNSGANLFLGTEAFTSILSSGTANNVGGGAGGGSSFSWGGTRAVKMGGYSNSVSRETKIQYWDMSTASNASDFGDLTSGRYQSTGLSNATRGLCARGVDASDAKNNFIDYVTISTTGNSTDFGDCLGASGQNARNGACDGTTGLWAGQDIQGVGYTNVIESITVATTGNASDHGDLGGARIYVPMANDASRYVTMGAYASGGGNQINNIEYGTFIAGNSTDFGDLINIGYNGGTASDTTRALKAGGYYSSNTNVIEYVTIQTPGNGTDFGDLLSGQNGIGGFSDGTNAQFAGGWTYATPINTVVIQTTGNATDHGDLDTGLASAACCSGNAA